MRRYCIDIFFLRTNDKLNNKKKKITSSIRSSNFRFSMELLAYWFLQQRSIKTFFL